MAATGPGLGGSQVEPNYDPKLASASLGLELLRLRYGAVDGPINWVKWSLI